MDLATNSYTASVGSTTGSPSGDGRCAVYTSDAWKTARLSDRSLPDRAPYIRDIDVTLGSSNEDDYATLSADALREEIHQMELLTGMTVAEFEEALAAGDADDRYTAYWKALLF